MATGEEGKTWNSPDEGIRHAVDETDITDMKDNLLYQGDDEMDQELQTMIKKVMKETEEESDTGVRQSCSYSR